MPTSARETETIGMPATTGQLSTARTQQGHVTELRDTNKNGDASKSRENNSSRDLCIEPGRQVEQQRRSIANVTSNLDVRFSRNAIKTASKSRKDSLDFRRRTVPATPGTSRVGAGGEYTVKKGYRFSRSRPGCHLQNSPWPGKI
jgi:hypothetical protein